MLQTSRNELPSGAGKARSHADGILSDQESTSRSAWEIVNRLHKFKDAVFGPEPAAAGIEPQQPPRVAFFQRLEEVGASTKDAVNAAHELLQTIEERFGLK